MAQFIQKHIHTHTNQKRAKWPESLINIGEYFMLREKGDAPQGVSFPMSHLSIHTTQGSPAMTPGVCVQRERKIC